MVADIPEPVIACFGLAYKPDVGDLRESPAVEVCRLLAGLGRGKVLAIEPLIGRADMPVDLAGVELSESQRALTEADLAILLTDHDISRGLGGRARSACRVLDTRGAWTANASAADRSVGNELALAVA